MVWQEGGLISLRWVPVLSWLLDCLQVCGMNPPPDEVCLPLLYPFPLSERDPTATRG